MLGIHTVRERSTSRTQAKIGLRDCDWTMDCPFLSMFVVVNQSACSLFSGAPVRRSVCSWVKGKLLAEAVSAALWTSGIMSRRERWKSTRSSFTFRFQTKRLARRSRRNCQESSKTSTENCAGNIERVSSFTGPLCLWTCRLVANS